VVGAPHVGLTCGFCDRQRQKRSGKALGIVSAALRPECVGPERRFYVQRVNQGSRLLVGLEDWLG
jgi:hypothetical protein